MSDGRHIALTTQGEPPCDLIDEPLVRCVFVDGHDGPCAPLEIPGQVH